MEKPKVCIVEGEIAAGKTELVTAMMAELARHGKRACAVYEPVEKWKEIGILQKFYENPARYGYSFQTYVYATRILEIVKVMTENPNADVFLLERSPSTDQVFMELQRDLVDPVEMQMYYAWCEAYRSILPFNPAKARVVYLKTSLPECMVRLKKRGRAGEVSSLQDARSATDAKAGSSRSDASVDRGSKDSASGGVSLEYQARLRRAHEAFLLGEHAEEFPNLRKGPFEKVVVVGPETADQDFRTESELIRAILKSVELL